jgi:PAS domain-containing protein
MPDPEPLTESEAIAATFGEHTLTAAIAREIDWANHPLGPVRTWPPESWHIIGRTLDSVWPTFVLWGPHHHVFINDAAIPAFGPEHAELFGRPYPESRPELIHALFARAAMNGMRVSLQAALPNRSGGARQAWYDITYEPIRSAFGDVLGVCGVIIDRTDDVLATGRTTPGPPSQVPPGWPATRGWGAPWR